MRELTRLTAERGFPACDWATPPIAATKKDSCGAQPPHNPVGQSRSACAMEFHLGKLLHEVEKAEMLDPAYFIEDAPQMAASVGEKDHSNAD